MRLAGSVSGCRDPISHEVEMEGRVLKGRWVWCNVQSSTTTRGQAFDKANLRKLSWGEAIAMSDIRSQSWTTICSQRIHHGGRQVATPRERTSTQVTVESRSAVEGRETTGVRQADCVWTTIRACRHTPLLFRFWEALVYLSLMVCLQCPFILRHSTLSIRPEAGKI